MRIREDVPGQMNFEQHIEWEENLRRPEEKMYLEHLVP